MGISCYSTILFSGICVVVGAMTKRAQVPFSSWLPAAMAAPTPVSSLVHSSTLVTAGVYLLIRFYPSLRVYEYFYFFIFYVGVITCLIARFSALYENDLKKIVALSTLSQLGVIMIALGLGFPIFSFFHLVTHALFKALLFICAGTIIHRIQNNQDIRLMGNLWARMPVTCRALNVANLALCGFPFMAGFYSKDLVFESFLCSRFPVRTGILVALSICITGGYSVRLSVFTLWRPYKGLGVLLLGDERLIVYMPVFVLLLGSVFGGAVFFWVLSPFVGLFFLPFYLKILAFFLIFFIGGVSFFLVELGHKWVFSYFMGSMWFLGFITSSPGVGFFFFLGGGYVLQELRWMELVRGKGFLYLFTRISSFWQRRQNFSFSVLFSFFTLVFGFFLLFF